MGDAFQARAATPSGLSRFASSCQHRIAIAERGGRWTAEETRLLLAMSGHRIPRKVIARVLLRSPKSIKTRLEVCR